jgi:cytochrome bd ubiquinol oxidase subunit II
MLLDYETLKIIWWVFIGVLLIGFAITGGFDLGVGILLPTLTKKDEERRVMLNSIGPTWDGNQVWFLTAGGAIFAAWPFVYATAFSGFYFALLLVLFALILRPPGLDYRSKLPSKQWRSTWDWCLFISGFVPSLIFGVAFGNLLQGVPFHFDEMMLSHYTGSFWGLLNPFALLTGIVSLSMLAKQGALFLQLKTKDKLQQKAIYAVKITTFIFLISFIFAGLWGCFGLKGFYLKQIPDLGTLFSPLHKIVEVQPGAQLGFFKAHPVAWAVPIFAVLGSIFSFILSRNKKIILAILSHSLVLACVILTAGFSLFPFIMPSSSQPNHSLTIWDATSSYLTLTWMFWAVVFFLPIVISYTIWVYRVFSGPIGKKELSKAESY